MINLTPEQAAYLAALIDGEGSLECQRQMPVHGRTWQYRVRLSFTMATEEPLKTVASWLGAKSLYYPAADATRGPRWRLHIPKGTLMEVLPRIEPYLILKREQAQVLMSIEGVRREATPGRRHYGLARLMPMPAHAVADMERLYRRLRLLKA